MHLLTSYSTILDAGSSSVQGHFMYVSNLEEYGHLLNGDNFNTNHLNNDMYMLFDNRLVSSGGIPLA